MRWRFVSLALALLLPTLAAGGEARWLAVVAPAYREALAPLVEHREAQGFRVSLLESGKVPAEKLRDRIHEHLREHDGPHYVLLAGAIDGPPDRCVPALRGTISRMKGEPSDNGYGCPRGGRVPTVAVGRFPARSVEEVRSMVARTLAYETAGPGAWKRRLNVLAGIPAYNPVVDWVVESLAMARFADLDPAWTGRALYTNAASPFCLPEGCLRSQSLAYLQKGQAFLVYLGHSNPLGLYAGRARFLDRTDWSRVAIPAGRGVFLTFGCNGCQLKGLHGEGYGVAALRNPTGPAAVVGSHGICYAAMVQLAADGLFARTFTDGMPERLGETWLAMQQGVAEGPIDDFTYQMLDRVDGDPSIPQATQRQEHLEMFVLLGDPALRLPVVPDDVTLALPREVSPGQRLTIKGTLPARLKGATVRITLERRVHSRAPGLARLPAEPGPERDHLLQVNHERANRFVLASTEVETGPAGTFAATLELPDHLPWDEVVVRAWARTTKREGMKVVVVPVKE